MTKPATSPSAKVLPAQQGAGDLMGMTRVDVTLSPPGDRTRKWTGTFLVDTGAVDSLAPANELHALGIQPEGKRVYELAAGTHNKMEYGIARIEFFGEITSGDVTFGPDGCEPILGVTALE